MGRHAAGLVVDFAMQSPPSIQLRLEKFMSRSLTSFLCIFVSIATSVSCAAASHVLFTGLGPAEAALYVSNADGSGERILQRSGSLDYDPSWSPKGDRIVFTSERTGPAELFRIHPGENNPRPCGEIFVMR